MKNDVPHVKLHIQVEVEKETYDDGVLFVFPTTNIIHALAPHTKGIVNALDPKTEITITISDKGDFLVSFANKNGNEVLH